MLAGPEPPNDRGCFFAMFSGPSWFMLLSVSGRSHSWFCLRSRHRSNWLTMPMQGPYQLENAVLEGATRLTDDGVSLCEIRLRKFDHCGSHRPATRFQPCRYLDSVSTDC
jgi:hypothetical protein